MDSGDDAANKRRELATVIFIRARGDHFNIRKLNRLVLDDWVCVAQRQGLICAFHAAIVKRAHAFRTKPVLMLEVHDPLRKLKPKVSGDFGQWAFG